MIDISELTKLLNTNLHLVDIGRKFNVSAGTISRLREVIIPAYMDESVSEEVREYARQLLAGFSSGTESATSVSRKLREFRYPKTPYVHNVNKAEDLHQQELVDKLSGLVLGIKRYSISDPNIVSTLRRIRRDLTKIIRLNEEKENDVHS